MIVNAWVGFQPWDPSEDFLLPGQGWFAEPARGLQIVIPAGLLHACPWGIPPRHMAQMAAGDFSVETQQSTESF